MAKCLFGGLAALLLTLTFSQSASAQYPYPRGDRCGYDRFVPRTAGRIDLRIGNAYFGARYSRARDPYAFNRFNDPRFGNRYNSYRFNDYRYNVPRYRGFGPDCPGRYYP